MPRVRRLAFVVRRSASAPSPRPRGYFLFNRPHADQLTKADAIVVLGGDWDNRVGYGLDLARQGYARRWCCQTSTRATATRWKGVQTRFRVSRWSASGPIRTPPLARRCSPPTWPANISGRRDPGVVELPHGAGPLHLLPVFRRRDHPAARASNLQHLGVRDWSWIYAYQFGALVKATILGCRSLRAMDVRLVDHPLAAARLTTLRDEHTDNAGFRAALRDLTLMLVYEATRDAPRQSVPVRTPLAAHHRLPAGQSAAVRARVAGGPRHGRPGSRPDPRGARRLHRRCPRRRDPSADPVSGVAARRPQRASP